jgi:hypothetical protein
MSVLESCEPYTMTRTVLTHLDKNAWNMLFYWGFGVLPNTPLFDREKALNIQRCVMEHMRRGFPLRKNYFDIVEDVR